MEESLATPPKGEQLWTKGPTFSRCTPWEYR